GGHGDRRVEVMEDHRQALAVPRAGGLDDPPLAAAGLVDGDGVGAVVGHDAGAMIPVAAGCVSTADRRMPIESPVSPRSHRTRGIMQQQQIQQIIGNFHQLYYYLGITKQGTWTHTYWMGV